MELKWRHLWVRNRRNSRFADNGVLGPPLADYGLVQAILTASFNRRGRYDTLNLVSEGVGSRFRQATFLDENMAVETTPDPVLAQSWWEGDPEP